MSMEIMMPSVTVLIITTLAIGLVNYSNVYAEYEFIVHISEALQGNGLDILPEKPGTFVLKNNDSQPRTIRTDFAGNMTLAPGQEFRYPITDEGKYTFTIDNKNIKNHIIFQKPEVETDPQVLQRASKITDLEQQKVQLEKQLEQLQRRISDIENRAWAIAKERGISVDEALAPEQDELNALTTQYYDIEKQVSVNGEIPKEIEKTRTEIRDIKRGIEIIPAPTIDLDQVRNSTDIVGWVKNLFTWHDEGLISTGDLITVIKYLIEQQIIT